MPCKSVLVSKKPSDEPRKWSAASEGGGGSRKVSFVFDDLPANARADGIRRIQIVDQADAEQALNAQLDLARQAGEMDDFVSSSNNLNAERAKFSPPMI